MVPKYREHARALQAWPAGSIIWSFCGVVCRSSSRLMRARVVAAGDVAASYGAEHLRQICVKEVRGGQ